MEFPVFLKYFAEYSYIFPKSKIAKYWDQYKENLERNIPDHIPIYKIIIPVSFDSKINEKIQTYVESTSGR